jgi:hypothetical protein
MSNHILWLMPVASQNWPTFIATLARCVGGGGGERVKKCREGKNLCGVFCVLIVN